MKWLSCRRAPDAKRGCPPATVVTRASNPFIPEAGAAPRHLSSGGQVGGGCLGAVCPQEEPSDGFCMDVDQTKTITTSSSSSLLLSSARPSHEEASQRQLSRHKSAAGAIWAQTTLFFIKQKAVKNDERGRGSTRPHSHTASATRCEVA